MEFIRPDSEKLLRLVRQRGIFGYYAKMLILWTSLYVVTVFIVLKHAYYFGGNAMLRNEIVLAEIGLAAVAAICGYQTHQMHGEVRAALEADNPMYRDRSLLARSFSRAFYNLGGLLAAVSAANLLVAMLLGNFLS